MSRFLISTKIHNIVVHGYFVRRGRCPPDELPDEEWAAKRVDTTAQRLAAHLETRWLPVLLSTAIDAADGRYIEGLLVRYAMPEVEGFLQKYRNRQQPLFFAIWIMEESVPDCVKLLELH